MKTGEKLTLIDIFTTKDLSVQIPIIQRDYAQGRNNKKSIRNEFLTVLFNALQDDKIVDLDFVYGYLENSKFIPLDGQQRLTTLFLLHYFLAIMDEKFDSFKTIFQQGNMSKFTYQTRHSSRSFFDNLVLNGEVILNEDITISKLLKDQKWYFYEWENDPTVSGALTVLDAIEEKFKDSFGYFEKLVNNKLISFEFLNLDEYNLSDDLYIKMNARGKSLTSFENFKARFESIIESVDSDLRKEFVNSIDTTWCDLFWSLSKEYTPEKPAVDQLFLNYFGFITGILFNKDEEISSNNEYDFNNFEIINLIYSSKENLKFLIDSLNLISASKDDVKEINLFFDYILTNESDKNKVNIFEEETNLLTKLLFSFSSITHLDRFLLYSIIEFHLKFDFQKLTITNEIIELSRLVRNFVVDINQKGNDNSRDDVVPNIRFSNYPEIVGFIDKIISEKPFDQFVHNTSNSTYRKEFVQREITKINYISLNPQFREAIQLLENHPNLKGNLSSFDVILQSTLDINNVANNFVELWETVETDDIVRCLLSYGDYSVHVGKCYFGDLRYFGNKNKWERIFYANEKLPTILLDLFTDIGSVKQKTVKVALQKIKKKDVDQEWRKLFINYSKMLVSDTNIYSFRDEEYYKIDALDRHTLRGYHINSFVNAVLQNSKLLSSKKIKNNGWEVDTNESVIQLKNSAYMTPVNDGWFISHSTKDIMNSLNGLFFKELDKKGILITPSKKQDIIEVAIIFLNNYYN